MKKLASIIILVLLLISTAIADDRSRGVNVYGAITEEGIEKLASWNVNEVRYGLVSIAADDWTEEEYRTWVDEQLDALDVILPIFAANGIKIVLNLHTPPGGLAVKTEPAWHRIFKEEWAQDALVNVWRDIAIRYLGNEEIVAFELVNEPAEKKVNPGLKSWKFLSRDVIRAIREVDPSRRIVVQPVYGVQERLSRLGKLPFDNIIYSVHFYYPFIFTKQGIGGLKLGKQYPSGDLNKKKLKKFLAAAIKFKNKHRVPMSVGEFSVVRWAPKLSAVRYLKHLIQIFEKNKWDWSYHAFRESHVWSLEHTEDFNSIELSAEPTARELLLRSYFEKNSR